MTKKQLWNIKRKLRRRTLEARMGYALERYFMVRSIRILANFRTCGFTDKGYLKRRVTQPLEYTNGR